MKLEGIHHVTSITADAQANVDLYAGRLNLDLATVNGEWALPMPARFVIDRAGIVRFVETDADYRTRPDPATTLAALRVLG